MSDIFISYRRQDAAAEAGRLYDRLVLRYGRDRVFYDIADLDAGLDFAKQLHGVVASSKSVLVVIGRHWLTATDANGRPRVEDPQDFIRTEVAAALRANKHVVPILVGGAMMPSPDELPDELRGIALRQAIELRDATWDQDLLGLYYVLDRLLNDDAVATPVVSATASVPAARLPFVARILAAFDALTRRGGGEGSEPARPASGKGPRAAPVPQSAEVRPREDAQPTAARKQIFVSHAEEDLPLADEVVQLLEGRGHHCWIAHRNIPPGTQSWAGPIVAAIADSKVVLILVTPYSVASKQVLREVTVADDENIPLIPVCLDNVSLSKDFRYFFASAQRLEIADTPRQQTLQMIGNAVERQLAGP